MRGWRRGGLNATGVGLAIWREVARVSHAEAQRRAPTAASQEREHEGVRRDPRPPSPRRELNVPADGPTRRSRIRTSLHPLKCR
jgi:hypothetical protein